MDLISAWTDLVQPGGRFRYGSLSAGQAPTPLKAEWLNMMQEEIANVVLHFLPGLDKENNAQLLKVLVDKFAQKATTLAGYGILDAYTKNETDLLLSKKANWAVTLAGYGINDAYTKLQVDNLLLSKANKATTLAGYGIADTYTKTQIDELLLPKAPKATTVAGYGITDSYTKTEMDALLLLKAAKSTASLGINGWHLDASTGRLEVWGQVTVEVPTNVGDRTDAAVVFPAPFPSAVFNVSCSNAGGHTTEIVENLIGFSLLTKTGMTVSVKRVSGTQTGGEKVIVHYRAIGN